MPCSRTLRQSFFKHRSFRTKTEKLLLVKYICYHVVLEQMLVTVPVKLYGRSHPDPKTLQWWSTLRVMNPMGVKDGRGSKVPYEVHGFNDLISRRS